MLIVNFENNEKPSKNFSAQDTILSLRQQSMFVKCSDHVFYKKPLRCGGRGKSEI
jgi:hypothetical protein